MRDNPLRAMAVAPRDGTPIIAFFDDFSGCEILYWGEAVRPPHEAGWFEWDRTDTGLSDEDYAGWIPAPDNLPEYRPRPSRRRENRHSPSKLRDRLTDIAGKLDALADCGPEDHDRFSHILGDLVVMIQWSRQGLEDVLAGKKEGDDA